MGSANVEGNGEGMKQDREYEVRIRKCANRHISYIQGVSGLSKIDNNFPYKNIKSNNND